MPLPRSICSSCSRKPIANFSVEPSPISIYAIFSLHLILVIFRSAHLHLRCCFHALDPFSHPILKRLVHTQPLQTRPNNGTSNKAKARADHPCHDVQVHSTIPRSRWNNLSSSYIPQGSLMLILRSSDRVDRISYSFHPVQSTGPALWHTPSSIATGIKGNSLFGTRSKW